VGHHLQREVELDALVEPQIFLILTLFEINRLDENVFLVPYKEEFAVLLAKILYLWVINVNFAFIIIKTESLSISTSHVRVKNRLTACMDSDIFPGVDELELASI
jgi:hypothetical protein